MLDSLDQRVEAGAPGFDARLEERLTLGAFLPKSRRETVVLREVEVDDREGPGASPSLSAALSSTKRRGLQETRGDVTRLRQQEEADLGDMRPGRDVDEVVGGAGSTTLVFQTILFPLMLGAKEPSVVTFEGGTHNPMAPPVPFLERAFLPVLDRMGGRVDVTFERYGFYPSGGGRWTATIYPAATLERLELLHRGEVRAIRHRIGRADSPCCCRTRDRHAFDRPRLGPRLESPAHDRELARTGKRPPGDGGKSACHRGLHWLR